MVINGDHTFNHGFKNNPQLLFLLIESGTESLQCGDPIDHSLAHLLEGGIQTRCTDFAPQRDRHSSLSTELIDRQNRPVEGGNHSGLNDVSNPESNRIDRRKNNKAWNSPIRPILQ